MALNLFGSKKGMTHLFDENGNRIVCTLIAAEANVVVQVKTQEKDGYRAVQVGGNKVAESNRKNLTKPLVGHFSKAKVEPRRFLIESRIKDDKEFELGQEIHFNYFSDVKYVDVFGISKGKGFQGVMKKHGFAGGPGAHGSGFKRTAGSTGMRSTPGRCLPGRKMAGQMGGERSVAMNLEVVRVDLEKQFLIIKGAVPGPKNGIVFIRKSVKKPNK